MNVARRSIFTSVVFTGVMQPLLASAKLNQFNILQSDIDKTVEQSGVLRLAAGTFFAKDLRIEKPLRIEGIPGQTLIIADAGHEILQINDTQDVSLYGVHFSGLKIAAVNADWAVSLVKATPVENLIVESCQFSNSTGSGLRLDQCSGRITGNTCRDIEVVGIRAFDSKGLEISGNHVHDIGNNGIQVWRNVAGEDDTRVVNNHVHHIKANEGGSGQNGNGINLFLADNCIVANNRVHDVAYSGIRNNSSSNCAITDNSISRCAETALYVEFGFQGAIIANNVIEDAAFGISITNFNKGGRLALCTGNIIRHMHRGNTAGVTDGGGIHAEADSLISNNILEDIEASAINLGWGEFARTLSAQCNMMRNCGRGITFSAVATDCHYLISGNVIEKAALAAIQGLNHYDPVTSDLGQPGSVPPLLATVANNVVIA